jgi:hypothetical protein
MKKTSIYLEIIIKKASILLKMFSKSLALIIKSLQFSGNALKSLKIVQNASHNWKEASISL